MINNNLNLPLQLTEIALIKLKNLILDSNNPNLKFRIYIVGGGCSGFKYEFTLDDKINDSDITIEKEDIILVIDSMSLQYLIGSTIDYNENLKGSYFVVHNPNAKITCSCGYSFGV